MKTCKHEINTNYLMRTDNPINCTSVFTTKCIKCDLPISVELHIDATIPPHVLEVGIIGELNKKVKELNGKIKE